MPQATKIPQYLGPPTQRSPGLSSREYAIRLLTPLFGGGVDPGENDPAFPIRETSIRGQLQFWWRATRGAAFETPEQLHARHAEVWGTTERASPVWVSVDAVATDQPAPCAAYRWNPQARRGQGGWSLDWLEPFRGTDLLYALFPFQGEAPPLAPTAQPRKAPRPCIRAGSFRLSLRFPEELRTDVEAAVWAWVNFGGLGARTRRGCGALHCRELAPTDAAQVGAWYSQKRTAYGLVDRPAPPAWPVLTNSFLYRPDALAPIPVWSKLMALWKYFRQGEGFARNPGQRSNRPGRSRYPEPETIREATGADRNASGHHRLETIPDDAFPRAELGLPIVFHFQGSNGEPPDTTLHPVHQGKRKERMGSPLILKPLALADGRAVRIILPLAGPGVSEVELTTYDEAARQEVSLGSWGSRAIRDPRLATYPNSPLAGSPSGSALEAFLDFAQIPAAQDGPGYVETTP